MTVSDISIKLIKVALALIGILVVLVIVVSWKDMRREIIKNYTEITKESVEQVEPVWDIPEWAKEKCNDHFIVFRCNINLFMELDYLPVVDRYGNYRDYNGNYLIKACGTQKSSECDFYDRICGELKEKIICNEEHW
ncbi:hypothetical protein KAS31_00725 [Candidatus Parcubacteria bacterium]|nr:hypothetical protein [Candidatus Parcubacteria bacterium]